MKLDNRKHISLRVLNVGQGLSIILEFGDDQYGIIDCFTFNRKRPRVLKYINKAPSFIIITHPDTDHYYGLSMVLEHSKANWGEYCDVFYQGQIKLFELEYLKWSRGHEHNGFIKEEIIKLNDILSDLNKKEKTINDSIGFWIADGIWCEPIAPPQDKIDAIKRDIHASVSQRMRTGKPKSEPSRINLNCISLGFYLIYSPGKAGDEPPTAGATILVGGDVPEEVWKALLKKGRLRKCDCVIVPHHGGYGNSIELWETIAKVGARAIISCGHYKDAKTRTYGHPDLNTLIGIHSANAKVSCTNLGCQCEDPLIGNNIKRQKKQLAEFENKMRPYRVDKCFEDYMEDNKFNLSCSGDLLIRIFENGESVIDSGEIICAKKF